MENDGSLNIYINNDTLALLFIFGWILDYLFFGWILDTLEKLLADVCPTQFGRDKIDCSHAKCRRCCFYFCDNFHFPTNKKEEKTIAAVIYYKKLNILSALINIYLNFKISTSSSQTIPFQFLYFLSRLICVGQTSAKSFWSVKCGLKHSIHKSEHLKLITRYIKMRHLKR